MDAKAVFAGFESEAGFDLAGLDAMIAELRGMAKDKRAEMKDVLKEQKEADKAAAAEAGKAFYDGLAIGEEFDILISGKPVRVAKIATKSKSSNSAACAIVGWSKEVNGGATPNRYLGFDKVVIAA